MLFHTWTFAVFFGVFYAGHLALRRTRLREVWLLAGSYAFYAGWNPWYLLLILYSTAVDYFGVTAMARCRTPRGRKLWLGLTILNNLLLLGTFKYGKFLVLNASAVLGWLGIPYAFPEPGWAQPVGLSFYTFQSMSYAIDFYRGLIPREASFLRYATFVSLFPQMEAGPIVRASQLLPQLREPRPIARQDIAEGLSLFAVGLFKKLALADYLALYVNQVYGVEKQVGVPGGFNAPALVLATVAFGWQIYFDFSGYMDMAMGIGRLLGYRYPANFRHPYLAAGLGEFWQRWNISLSTWFRDYLYIPLGGNRKGELATYRNMCLTMLVSGLWHGAAWTFVLWGALHALGRALTRHLETRTSWVPKVPRIVKQAAVFAFVTFAWIFFRALSISDAWLVVRRIFTTAWTDPAFPLLAGALVAAVWVYQYLYESRLRAVLQAAPVRLALMAGMIVYLAIVPAGAAQPFYYFQF